MKKSIIIFLFIMASRLSAQTFSQTINQMKSQGILSQKQALFYEGLRAVNAEKLPSELQIKDELPDKSAVGLSYSLYFHSQYFTEDEKQILEPFFSRPKQQASAVSRSGFFRVHYDTSGVHAPDLFDGNNTGIPDFIDVVLEAMDYSYDIIINVLGYQLPPSDEDADGPEYDIYIRNISGYYGWTVFEKRVEENAKAWISYIVLDNSYRHTPTQGDDGARVTAAHEFFHMVQLGYNGRDENQSGRLDDEFFMEASSTWMEDVVYNDINDYYYYLPDFFRNISHRPFDSNSGLHPYGLCVWLHYLENYHDISMIREIWEEIVNVPALEANDRVLRQYGGHLGEDMARFYGWNVMTGSRADTIRFYPEGKHYPEIYFSGEYHFTEDTSITVNVTSKSAKYYLFTFTDGYLGALVPANTYWDDQNQSADSGAKIDLMHGFVKPFSVKIGNNYSARLSAENINWFCTGIILNPDNPHGAFYSLFQPAEAEQLPDCYPNPFNRSVHVYTSIPFLAEKSSSIRIDIYSSSMRRVWSDQSFFSAGFQAYRWNGTNSSGTEAAGGVYIYVISSGQNILRRGKIALIR